MNILWINHEYPPIGGGGATVTKALAREFAALGHSVTVVTAGLNNGKSGTDDVGADIIRPQTKGMRHLAHFETADGVDIYRLKCRRKKKDSSTFFEMLSFLHAAFHFVPGLVKKRITAAVNGPGAETSRQNQPFDIALISFGIPSGPLGLYLKRRFKLPYIVRLGGGDIPGTQKRFKIIYAVLGPVIRKIWKNAAYVVANSQGLRERAEMYYNKANFTVINNGINIDVGADVIRPQKEEPKESAFRLITTARIVERKGIRHVVEALPRLLKETNGNIRYTVVGDGPYRDKIEALASRLGVSDHLEITGMLPHDEVIAKLQQADVFVLASHWEGMPNSVIEAMAAGLPIIMSDCEGSAELVDGNGFIVENGENIADELANKILELYNNRKLVAQLGQKSYERVCERFRWEKVTENWLKIMTNAQTQKIR